MISRALGRHQGTLRNVDGATNQDEHAPGAVEPVLAQSKSGLLDELLDLDGHSSGRPEPAVLATGLAIGPTITPTITLGMRVGWLVGWAPGEAPKVEFPGNPRGPLSARSIIPLDPELVAVAIAERRGVLLSFEDGRPDAPIVTGILQPLVYVAADVEPQPIREPEPPREPEPVPTPEPEPIPPPDRGPEIEPPMPQPEIEPPMPQPEIEPPMREPEFEPPMREPEFEPPSPAPEVEFDSSISELDARVDGRRVEIEAADEIVLRCGQASIVLRRNGRVVIRGTYVETRSRGVNRIKGGSVEIN
jgi:hypothetical protein